MQRSGPLDGHGRLSQDSQGIIAGSDGLFDVLSSIPLNAFSVSTRHVHLCSGPLDGHGRLSHDRQRLLVVGDGLFDVLSSISLWILEQEVANYPMDYRPQSLVPLFRQGTQELAARCYTLLYLARRGIRCLQYSARVIRTAHRLGLHTLSLPIAK